MPMLIEKPTIIKPAGNKAKIIEEYIGMVNSATTEVSIAKMKSPSGWEEPPQTPEFNEYTLVLKGELSIKTEKGNFVVKAGQAFIAAKGEKVQYSTFGSEDAEYIAVCVPAFTEDTVNRAG
ncbi:MAG TPA: cupin [Caldithrix abyssi]|uniref:Cupin n=1 Tax=Caldithrix abyssi TaxID=187145 RepID=A0A7V4TYV4_CALAY|nr:cupin [Caldithrix abyssi]